jgi:alkylation response protein AidB-like acyl-CoA dehydrogenase
MSEHRFDTAVIGEWSDEITFPVEFERSIAYAKATNDPIPQHLDGSLAPEGQGFIQLMQQLPQERLLLAVSAAATVEKVVQVTLAYAKERTAFGKPIFGYQNTKFVLAECDTLATVCWAFLDDCIEKHLASELDSTAAAKAKWWLTEQQCIVVDRCVQGLRRLRLHD